MKTGTIETVKWKSELLTTIQKLHCPYCEYSEEANEVGRYQNFNCDEANDQGTLQIWKCRKCQNLFRIHPK